MPFVDPVIDTTLVADGVPPDNPPAPGIGATFGAAFRQDNEVVSLYRRAQDEAFPPDPSYNPLPDIRNTPYFHSHADAFTGSHSAAETEAIKQRIDTEEADRRTLAASGFAGTVAELAAGVLNPSTWLIPVGGEVALAARGGLAAARVGQAARLAAGFGAGATASEGVLQGTHETRTLGESAQVVATSAVLGALLGPFAVARMAPAERLAAENTLHADRIAMAEHAGNTEAAAILRKASSDTAPLTAEAGGGLAQPAGAAATATADVKPIRTILGGTLDRFDPMSRLLSQESVSARRAAVDLAETPLMMEQNVKGIATNAGPAVDRTARLVREQLNVAAHDEVQRLFTEYRFGDPATTYPRLRAQMQDFQGRSEGYMTFEQFDAEIAKAMRRGDVHDIPQVQQAAQFMRKHYDDWKQRAVDAGFFPEDVKPAGADSYLNRVYNKDAIAARRNEFVDKVTEYYRTDQATKAAAKERITGLNRDLQGLDEALAKAKTPERIGTLTASRNELLARIEKELADWQGGSAAEARAAMRARDKQPPRQDGARRTGADDAITKAVKKILESDRDRSLQELRARANETTDRILSSPDGRLAYDEGTTGRNAIPREGEPPRGPLAARRFNIPDTEIEQFLEPSALKSHRNYLRTVVPDVLLTERFGDTAMTETFRKINEEYAALSAAAKSDKARTALEKQRNKAIDDLSAIRDRIRGVYGFSPDLPMRNAARVANAVKSYNVISLMGMSAVSSLPDMAGQVFRHGLSTALSDAWVPFARYLTGSSDVWKQAAKQYRAMGIATEMFSATRMHALADITDMYRPGSRAERALSWGADKFQMVSMLAPWTDWAKVNASMVAGSEILRATKAVSEGKATARQLRQLAESNIEPAMATRIWKQFEAGGEVRDGVHLPNTGDWTDASAKLAFEGAVGREADISVVTPGQEKPLWLSTPVVSLLGQFKSFTAASTQRILLANLQRADAQTLQGLVFSIGMGMLAYKLNNLASGRETSARPQDWIKEAIDRGGILGWIGEGNALASKATRGGVDLYRLIGADKPLSRYASRSVLDQLIGPTAGKVEAITGISGKLGAKLAQKTGANVKDVDWKYSDTSALRRLTAMQNTFYLRRLFDEVEAAGNRQFGIEPRAAAR